jgi:hypothetical protein
MSFRTEIFHAKHEKRCEESLKDWQTITRYNLSEDSSRRFFHYVKKSPFGMT